jgi:hypothetical protein
MESPAGSPAITPRKPTARSRVSNGKDWLAGVDQRSSIARRYRDLMAEAIADSGGLNECSQARLQLIRRLAALSVQLEALEAKLAEGAEIDITEYTVLTSTLVRVISRLGLERRSRGRDVTPPSVAEYLKHKQQQINKEAVS